MKQHSPQGKISGGCPAHGEPGLPNSSSGTWALGCWFTAGSQMRWFDSFVCEGACLPPLVILGAWGEFPPAPALTHVPRAQRKSASLGQHLPLWHRCNALAQRMRWDEPGPWSTVKPQSPQTHALPSFDGRRNCASQALEAFFCLKQARESKWANTRTKGGRTGEKYLRTILPTPCLLLPAWSDSKGLERWILLLCLFQCKAEGVMDALNSTQAIPLSPRDSNIYTQTT